MTQENPIEVWKHLTYESLPWQTHPIDVAIGPQGWGPMQGPYTPFNFPDPRMAMAGGQGINCSWIQGDNTIMYAPGYADATAFADKATSLVNNQQYPGVASSAAFSPAQGGYGGGTISNQMTPNQVSPPTNPFLGFIAALRSGLGMK